MDIKKYIKESSSSKIIINFLEKIATRSPSKVFFIIIIFLSISYLSSPKNVWRTDFDLLFSLIYFTLIATLFFFSRYLKLLFFDMRYKKYNTLINLVLLMIISLISSITLSINFINLLAYCLFFNSISCVAIYCDNLSTDSALDKGFSVKIIALGLFIASLSLTIIYNPNDSLMLTTMLCTFPFYIISFLTNKIEALLLQYRSTFFIYLFFISTTIFPFLFIFSIILFFISKFYFVVKYNIKYPSFLNRYDTSR